MGIASLFFYRNQVVTAAGAAYVRLMRRSGARAEALSVIRLIGYLDTILYQNSIVVVDRINLLDIKTLMHVGELLACIVAHWVSGY